MFDNDYVTEIALTKPISQLFQSTQRVLQRGQSAFLDQSLRYLASTACDESSSRALESEQGGEEVKKLKTGTKSNRARRVYQECVGIAYLRLMQLDSKRTLQVLDRTTKELRPHLISWQSLICNFLLRAPRWLDRVPPITVICLLMFVTFMRVKLRQDNVVDGLGELDVSPLCEGLQCVLSDWKNGKRFPYHCEKFKDLWIEVFDTFYRNGVLGWNEDPPSAANRGITDVPGAVKAAMGHSVDLAFHLHRIFPLYAVQMEREVDMHMFGWKACVKDFNLESRVGDEGKLTYEEYQTDWLRTVQCLSGGSPGNDFLGMTSTYLAFGDIAKHFTEEDNDDLTLFGYQGLEESKDRIGDLVKRSTKGGNQSAMGRRKCTYVRDVRLQLEVLELWKLMWEHSQGIVEGIANEAEFTEQTRKTANVAPHGMGLALTIGTRNLLPFFKRSFGPLIAASWISSITTHGDGEAFMSAVKFQLDERESEEH